MTQQILAFFFCFIRELNLYSPLTFSLISARELKPFTLPLPSPSPPRANLNPLLPPYPPTTLNPFLRPPIRNQPSTLLSARVTYEHWWVFNQTQKKPTLKIPPSKAF